MNATKTVQVGKEGKPAGNGGRRKRARSRASTAQDTDKVWALLWHVGEIIQIPFELIIASYYIYLSVGWSFLPCVAIQATLALIIYSRIGRIQKNEEKLNKQKDLRMQYTSEALTNAKLWG